MWSYAGVKDSLRDQPVQMDLKVFKTIQLTVGPASMWKYPYIALDGR